MKVLFEGLALLEGPSGVKRRIVEMAKRLPEHGMDCALLLHRDHFLDPPANLQIIRRAWGGRGLARLLLPPRLRRLRAENPFDVVVSDVLPWPTAVPTIGVVHDLRHSVSARWVERFGYRHFLLRGLRGARRVHAVSESTREALRNLHLGDAAGDVVVIRNGINPKVFDPRPSAEDAEVLRGWKLNKPFVLWVGHLLERKDPLLALAAREWELRKGERGDRPFVFVGQGPLDLGQRIRDLAAAFPGKDVARLIPGCAEEELAALYRRAEATLVTSRLEGFSLIPLEALGCGCPLVISDLPVHRELFRGFATILDSRDPAVWAKALSQMEASPQQPVGPATERLVASLSWDAAAAAFAADLRASFAT